MVRFWPVPKSYSKKVPKNGERGAYKSNDYYDKLDIWHTGIDIFCPNGSRVIATEDCTVFKVWKFTGPPDASQYRPTWAVNVRLGDGRIAVYGEVRKSKLKVGQDIVAGRTIGYVAQVEHSRNEPDKKHRCMLHFELYEKGTKETVDWWPKNSPKPEGLLDPTEYLESCTRIC